MRRAVITAVIASGMVLTACTSGGVARSGAGPGATATAASGPISRNVTHDGLRLDVTVDPGVLVAGERARVSVRVTNVADKVRAIGDFGHCGGPGTLVDEALWPTGNPIVPTWDPATPLAAALRGHQPNPPFLSDPGIVACD